MAPARGENRMLSFMWCEPFADAKPDTHAAFSGEFNLDRRCEIEIRLVSPGPSLVWVDGLVVMDGPIRSPNANSEYGWTRLMLDAGKHLISIQASYEGVETRISVKTSPVLACGVFDGDREISIPWQALPLKGFVSEAVRVNPQLGWVEWCDTRENPPTWPGRVAGQAFRSPVPVEVARADVRAPKLAAAPVRLIGKGTLVETFGYERDDPAARFFVRDLEHKDLPPQGIWHRLDLGRVRLGRPCFVIDVPEGSVVEIAMSESLVQGRVSPWITLSGGRSCNLAHFVARGGKQTFLPISCKGGRYVELHVLSPGKAPVVLEGGFLERTYHGEPLGSFRSDDKALDKIWHIGVETHRACSEDTMIDNPTRERGEWAGDVGSVGLEVAAVAYSDLALLKRGLRHCAMCARDDGLVAGLCPGGGAYLSTYAAQWVSSCVRYWELTGDKDLLRELFPYAEANLKAFRAAMKPTGLSDGLGWAFVDWGYVRNEGPSDMALNMHYLAALKDMVRWCLAVGRSDRATAYQGEASACKKVLDGWLANALAKPHPWPGIGLQRAVLALRTGLLGVSDGKSAIDFIKKHYLECFPNNPHAPRLSSPSADNPQLITPYFSHFALAELFELGQADFVLDQFRQCWGWAMEEDRTTWVEVFDTRWSHCHGWSACPTWQLSRYVLGLRPRFDLGELTYDFVPKPCSLKRASGHFPFPFRDGGVDVSFERTSEGTHWRIKAGEPIHLRRDSGDIEVRNEAEFTVPDK